MTTFTAVASGGWRTPATWDVGSGYPDGLDDDFDITGYDVTIAASDDDIAGHGDIGASGKLTVGTGSSLELGNAVTPALDVLSGGELVTYGLIKGQPSGAHTRVYLRTGSTFTTPGAAHSLERIDWLSSLAHDVSDIFGATSEANQAGCQLSPYLGGVLTIDESIACYAITSGTSAGVVYNAGVTVKVATGQSLASYGNGYMQFNGTPASHVTIMPYAAGAYYMRLNPSTLHEFNFLDLDGYDEARLNDEDSTYNFTFSKHPQVEDPVVRPPILDIDDPLGRSYSRVHHKGNSAAIVELTGNWRISDEEQLLVDAMMNNALLVCYVSKKVQLGQARIVLHDYPHERGHPVVPYTIALQEAR